jgi:hypothetical protein
MNSAAEYVEMLLIYGKCGRNAKAAARMYAQRFPNRNHPNHKVIVVTQFKILNLNFRYRHNSAPNVKVLAARLGTKGWGWQSWGVGNSASGNIAGVEALGRAVEAGRSLFFGFSKRTHLAKSDPIFQKSVSYI